MITDKFLTFGTAQAITADAASTDYWDSLVANVGDGEELRFVAIVTEAFNTLTSLNVKLQSDDNSSFSSAADDITVNIALAGLTAGAKVVDAVLPRGVQRYIRGYADVVGTDPTTGKLSWFIVIDSAKKTVYPSGFTTGF